MSPRDPGDEPPTSGQVFFQGERQPDQPLTATVFQEFALFPWRTAEANVAFGLEELDIPAAERRAWVHRFIAMTGLEGFEAKYPHHMSIVADKGASGPAFRSSASSSRRSSTTPDFGPSPT